MVEGLVIREMTLGDLSDCERLAKEVRWFTSAESFARFVNMGCAWVGVVEGNVIATTTCIKYGVDKIGFVGFVIVHPSFRRRGIGSTLTMRAVTYLSELGVDMVMLDASDDGHRTYPTIGFKDVCVAKRHLFSFPVVESLHVGDTPEGTRLISSPDGIDDLVRSAARADIVAIVKSFPLHWGLVHSDSNGDKLVGLIAARSWKSHRKSFRIGPIIAPDTNRAIWMLTSVMKQLLGTIAPAERPTPSDDDVFRMEVLEDQNCLERAHYAQALTALGSASSPVWRMYLDLSPSKTQPAHLPGPTYLGMCGADLG
ncbi:hypothetical protein Pelo_14481 [Pelomyxa schiedti]|nr:hypothetical protein Pelo_14481 [Pelomyxa schiedti]